MPIRLEGFAMQDKLQSPHVPSSRPFFLACLGLLTLGCDQNSNSAKSVANANANATAVSADQYLPVEQTQGPFGVQGKCQRVEGRGQAFSSPVVVRQGFGNGPCGSRVSTTRWYYVPAGVNIAPDGNASLAGATKIAAPTYHNGTGGYGPLCKDLQTGNGSDTRFEIITAFCAR